MKIGIVWEHGVSEWSMRPFSGLADKHDVTVFVGKKNKFNTAAVPLKKVMMGRKSEFYAALKRPFFSLKHLKNKFPRFYFYLNSLTDKIDDSFDLIICHDGSRSLNTLQLLKKMRRFKLVVFYAENIPYKSIYDPKTDLIKKTSWESIDLLVPWCKTIEKTLLEEGVTRPMKTIFMGVDQEIFKPVPKDIGLCREYGLSSDKFTFSYIGKLVSWKGVQYLIYAANVLVKSGVVNFQITITGKGAQKENLEKIISDAGLKDYVKFTGFLPYNEIARLYSLADCVVLPSVPTLTLQEQFGMVLVEAMSCGKPVLTSRTGSIPEVAGGGGLLHTPGNWRELAEDMKKLMQDPVLYEDLSKKAYQLAIDEYSHVKTYEKLEKAIVEMVL